ACGTLTFPLKTMPSAGGLRHRARAGAREVDDEGRPFADFAGHRDFSSELLDDLARDGETEPPALGRDEILEHRLQAIRGDAAPGVVDPYLHAVLDRLHRGDDESAGRGGLDRVDHEVAIDAAEREDVPLDVERLG